MPSDFDNNWKDSALVVMMDHHKESTQITYTATGESPATIDAIVTPRTVTNEQDDRGQFDVRTLEVLIYQRATTGISAPDFADKITWNSTDYYVIEIEPDALAETAVLIAVNKSAFERTRENYRVGE